MTGPYYVKGAPWTTAARVALDHAADHPGVRVMALASTRDDSAYVSVRAAVYRWAASTGRTVANRENPTGTVWVGARDGAMYVVVAPRRRAVDACGVVR